MESSDGVGDGLGLSEVITPVQVYLLSRNPACNIFTDNSIVDVRSFWRFLLALLWNGVITRGHMWIKVIFQKNYWRAIKKVRAVAAKIEVNLVFFRRFLCVLCKLNPTELTSARSVGSVPGYLEEKIKDYPEPWWCQFFSRLKKSLFGCSRMSFCGWNVLLTVPLCCWGSSIKLRKKNWRKNFKTSFWHFQ